jgi:hypothetical protein
MYFSRCSFVFATLAMVSAFMQGETLTLRLLAGPYTISQETNGFQRVELQHFGSMGMPGEPKLPSRTFMIALPPGARVTRTDFRPVRTTVLEGFYRIAPAKPVVESAVNAAEQAEAIHKAGDEWAKRYAAAYASNAPFPSAAGRYCGQGQWRKYTYARVQFTPFSYKAASGVLSFIPSVSVSIEYSLPAQGIAAMMEVQRMMSDTVFQAEAAQWLVNYADCGRWYPRTSQHNSLLSSTTVQNDFVVLVPNSAVRQVMGDFKAWKEQTGHAVGIYRLDSIYAAASGSDDAERIWNFLHDNFPGSQMNIRYVLLVGTVQDLPIRILFPSAKEGGYASDFYYSKLTMPWDVDGDGRWGEFVDDNLDPTPDVIVGRIPFSDTTTVRSICTHMIAFEQAQGAWKSHALLAHGIMDFNDKGFTDGAVLAESLMTSIFPPHYWTATMLFEKKGIVPSTFSCDAPLSDANIVSRIAPQSAAVVNLFSHGDPDGMAGQVWIGDFNMNGRCDADAELTWNWIADDKTLPATVGSIVCCWGCSTNPVYQDISTPITSSLQLLRQPRVALASTYLQHGAPAAIGSTATAGYCQNWSSPSDPYMQSICYYFFDQLLDQSRKVGDAFAIAMMQYAQYFGLDRGIRVFNYFGDPSLSIPGFELRPGGTDVTVHSGVYYRFAADNGDNGDMYVGVLLSDPLATSNGHVWIYKSTDHGTSWSYWYGFQSSVGIRAFDLIVAEFGADEFPDHRVLVYWVGSDNTVNQCRIPLGTGSVEFSVIAAETGGNQPLTVSVARTPIPMSYMLYLAYDVYQSASSTFAAKVAVSSSNGIAWLKWQTMSGYLRPSIDAGAGGMVYLAATKDGSNDDIVCKRSTDEGTTWGEWVTLTTNDGAKHHDAWAPSLAASTTSAVPTVWVAYPYLGATGNQDLRIAYSTDAGARWTSGLTLAGNSTDEGWANMKGYRASPNQWINIAYAPNNDAASVQVLWQYTNGGNPWAWSRPRIVNGFGARPLCVPRLVYSPGSSATGSGVVYGGVGNSVYFSAPWLPTAQTVKSTQSNLPDLRLVSSGSGIVLNTTIRQPGPLNVMIHDIAGKLVRVISDEARQAGPHTIFWDGQADSGKTARPGRYLCTIQGSDWSESRGFSLLTAGQTAPSTAGSSWVMLGNIPGAFASTSLFRSMKDSTRLYVSAVLSVNDSTNEGRVFVSTDGGATWTGTASIDSCWSLFRVVEVSSGDLFVCGMKLVGGASKGTIYRSTNNGAGWTTVLSGGDGMVYDLVEAKDGKLYLSTGWHGRVFESTNGGAAWQQVSEMGQGVDLYRLLQRSDGNMYAAGDMQGLGGRVLMSDRNSWMQWTVGSGFNGVVDAYDIVEARGKMYAGVDKGGSGRVYESDSTGLVWHSLSEFPDNRAFAVTALLADGTGSLCAGTELRPGIGTSEMFVQTTGSAQWTQIGSEVEMATSVQDIVKIGNKLIVATGNVYGYLYKYDPTLSVSNTWGVPTTFSVEQNYPNPFNPSTTIRYGLPNRSHVTLTVYNTLGQQVAFLQNGEQEAGYHDVKFDGSGLSSGVYFYRIESGSFVETRKLILLK